MGYVNRGPENTVRPIGILFLGLALLNAFLAGVSYAKTDLAWFVFSGMAVGVCLICGAMNFWGAET